MGLPDLKSLVAQRPIVSTVEDVPFCVTQATRASR